MQDQIIHHVTEEKDFPTDTGKKLFSLHPSRGRALSLLQASFPFACFHTVENNRKGLASTSLGDLCEGMRI